MWTDDECAGVIAKDGRERIHGAYGVQDCDNGGKPRSGEGGRIKMDWG